MKSQFVITLLLACISASAQQNRPDTFGLTLGQRPATVYNNIPNAWKTTTPYTFRQHSLQRDSSGKALIFLDQAAPGVYSLAIDGMPCVVPDTKGIAAIPNASPKVSLPFKEATGIPNPMDGAQVRPNGK